MNKPNTNQLETLRVIHRNVHCWELTNDIDSPTHNSDMGEDFSTLAREFGIHSEQVAEIHEKMLDILAIVRKIESPVPMENILKQFKKL
jgi:hypothetical protein